MKKGDIYTSRIWRNHLNNEPLKMKVTSIQKGVAYYRPIYGKHDDGTDWLGAPSFCDVNIANNYLQIEP